eukprot:superscaffoldBa00001384_g10321
MAERSLNKNVQSVVLQPKKRPSSSSKGQRSKRTEERPQAKSASGPAKKHIDDLFAKEEQYKLLNAELEAKTADLVRQADQLMKEQSEVLSKSFSTLLLTDIEDEEASRMIKPQQFTVQEPRVKVVTKKRVTSTSQNMRAGKKEKELQCKTATPKMPLVDDLTAVEDSADFFLAKTIRSMEEQMNDADLHDNVVDDVSNAGDNVGSGNLCHFAKSKGWFYPDDENAKLSVKIKEIEEDRARLQKTTSIQQTQIEKHRALAEESARKCDGLQVQVSGLHKEIENLNRSNKQAAAANSTVEVRLTRAQEEVERLKTQLNKMKQMNKDKLNEEHQSKENLLAENKVLKKQKAELIVGFKKQLKLIDILKRQKMHFEAAKLLSFTEDEFMKALDWGKS